jgi:N-acetylmuramoyl-L-alanine amidase
MISGRLAAQTWVVGCALSCALVLAAPLEAQEASSIRILRSGEGPWALEGTRERGYLSVPSSGWEGLGWTVERQEGGWRFTHPAGATLSLVPDNPVFRWNGSLQQLVDEPYLDGDELWVPAQLLLDFLPFHLPEEFRYVPGPDGPELHAGREAVEAAGSASSDMAPGPKSRVVVIDPGHGGRDLGAVGVGGTNEKDVALEIALALARELSRHPELDVRLTRESDVLVPLWQRGEWATEVKGDRPGVFVSIHVNALPDRTSRGFETYFLSEARTEHERRVAAIENAPADLGGDGVPLDDPGLGGILNELRNLDHQHWSALLAELVQARLGPVHPGPDRGVKQGPFAVITNALMPAVLVEVGFISNREEERLLGGGSFHGDVGAALAEAVLAFFERYPPGNGGEIGAQRAPGSRP